MGFVTERRSRKMISVSFKVIIIVAYDIKVKQEFRIKGQNDNNNIIIIAFRCPEFGINNELIKILEARNQFSAGNPLFNFLFIFYVPPCCVPLQPFYYKTSTF